MRDGKAQSCSRQPPRSSHPPGPTAHIKPPHGASHQVLPQQSEPRLVYSCSWWFVATQWFGNAQPWLSTSLEGGLKTSQWFWPPWRIISNDGACCPGLLLGMLLPGTQSNSQSFQMTLLWVLGTQGFSTQQPLRSWATALVMPTRGLGWSNPVSCLGKTSTDENGTMTKGREGKGMVST